MQELKFNRLIDIWEYQKEKFPQKTALGYKNNSQAKNFDEQWFSYSTDDCILNSNKVSTALLNLGINKGDKVAIISENCPEWILSDSGIMQIGAINVPLYPTISEKDYKYIFNEADVKFAFISGKEILSKINAVRHEIPSLKKVITFDEVDEEESFSSLIDSVQEIRTSEIQKFKNEISENDLATIIYTSGTTGKPKGVMLTHKNIVSNVKSCLPLLPVDHRHKALSFLPLNHVFERMLTYLYIASGLSVYYAESLETIGDNLREVKPEVFSAVPRLLEKVYEKIMQKGDQLSGIKRALFYFAIRQGEQYEYRGKSLLYKMKLKIARKLIFTKWQEALGGNVKLIISGSAPLSARLNKIFTSAGIDIMEGYGLTETSPVIAVNRYEIENRYFGTVGPVIDSVTVKIADDGEIIAKGPNVMLGYYKNPEDTKDLLSEDGWFKTGDIGEWVEGKFLKITDRKNSLFKTSGGKWVAPLPIESTLTDSIFIQQVMVLGKGKKFVSALIVPDFEKLQGWAKRYNIHTKSNKELCNHPKVLEKFDEVINEINKNFGHVEQIKKFKLLFKEWTIEDGELTPTMKVRRKEIAEKYQKDIEEIYEENEKRS